MAFKKWFVRDKEEDAPDPLKDYNLNTMRIGYLVDYDMETWEVIGCNSYDYDGFVTEEWVLKCSNKVAYLERADSDGEVTWTLTQNISPRQISEDAIDHTLEHENPPEVLTYNGRGYTLTESGGGVFRENDEGPGEEFISWSYCDDSGKHVLFIIQWGERDFKSVAGEYVEEYQFTNILPRGSF